jgi:hypothetical protein
MTLRDSCRVRTADHYVWDGKIGPQCGPYEDLRRRIVQGH